MLDSTPRCSLCSKPLSPESLAELCHRCEITLAGADSLERAFRVLAFYTGALVLRSLARGDDDRAARCAHHAAHLAHLGGVDGLVTLGLRIARILETFEEIANEPRFHPSVKTTVAQLAVLAVARRIHSVLFPEGPWHEL
jgi:hypothetical protein